MDNNLENLKKSVASSLDDVKKVIADMPIDKNKDAMDKMHEMCMGLYNYMDSIASNMYNYQDSHRKGHIPPMKSKEQMNKVIKVLGLGDEYKTEPTTIYANRNGYIIEAEYKKEV